MINLATSPNGYKLSIGDSPYDHLHLQFPKLNLDMDVTNDLATGTNFQMSRATAAANGQADGGGNVQVSNSNDHHGTGNVTFTKGSEADNTMRDVFNTVHPDNPKDASIDKTRKVVFNLIYTNEASGQNAPCYECEITNLPQVQKSSNETQEPGNQWPILSADFSEHGPHSEALKNAL